MLRYFSKSYSLKCLKQTQWPLSMTLTYCAVEVQFVTSPKVYVTINHCERILVILLVD